MSVTEGLAKMEAPPVAPEKKNGDDLPPPRQEAFANGLLAYQTLAAERDALVFEMRQVREASAQEVARLRSDLAGSRVVVEALQSQLADSDSRKATAYAERDEAVRRAAALETVLSSIMALGRVFLISHVPVVKTADPEEETPLVGGA